MIESSANHDRGASAGKLERLALNRSHSPLVTCRSVLPNTHASSCLQMTPCAISAVCYFRDADPDARMTTESAERTARIHEPRVARLAFVQGRVEHRLV